jgi:hypothetical protein
VRISLARYLLVRVAIRVAVINTVVNGLVAMAAFPAGRDVPLLGRMSACGDTLLASFLVAFLTMAGIAPAARRAARAGRVPGLGRKAPWLAWSIRHVLVSAIAVGALSVVLFGLPAARLLQSIWTHAMPRAVFIAFKAGYTGIFGALAAVVAALVGVATEPKDVRDPRWCLDPAASSGPVYPFDATDKVALAITSREEGTSGATTWELRVRGALAPAHVKRALADVALRYPILTTKVQSLDGVPPVAANYRYAFDPSFQIEAVFRLADARLSATLDALVREERSRPLDLYAEFPLTLTMAVTADDACRLLFRQHHALADGRAFFGLLADFALFLNEARAGRRPAPEALAPLARRGEVEAFGLSPAKQVAFTIAGVGRILGNALRALFSPLTPLLQNQGNDYSGENGTVRWALPDDVLARWDAARERLDVGLDTLFTGALLLANQRVHRARGLPLGRTRAQLAVETRPRGEAFVSFGNHLGFLFAEANLAEVVEGAALLRALEAEVARQREAQMPTKQLLAERWFVALAPLEALQRILFETTRAPHCMRVSNLIALDFAALGGEGWSVEDVLIATPVAPRHGIALTVVRYRGRVVFNFDYTARAATRDLAEEICGEFGRVIGEMTSKQS